MPKLEEVTFTLQRERIRFDGSNVALLECRQAANGNGDGGGLSPVGHFSAGLFDDPNAIVKCECEPDELTHGLDYRFFGTWHNHPKYGRQFHAKTFVRCQPHNRTGVIRYLMMAPNVGRVVAQKLWDKFGGDAVKFLREQPDVASAAASGQFNDGRAREAAAFLEHEKQIEDVTIDLMDLLSGHGFPKNTGKLAIGEMGNKAAELIRRNAFLLRRFPRCGFLLCDKLYLDLGGDPAKLKRQALCAAYVLENDSSGSTWHQPELIVMALRKYIAGTGTKPGKALALAKRAKLIATHRDERNRLWLAEAKKAENEAVVARRVREWAEEKADWPAVVELDVSEHQREQLTVALAGPLGIFTGGPGTGKTFSATRVIDAIEQQGGGGHIAVAAPTGKAAVRITEAMNGYGVQLRARTIHSLLKVASHTHGDGWSFGYDETNPLPYKYIVVDEASMIDTNLAASLFRACGRGTHVLLVGDTGQLPPVGHGAPLRDLIDAGVPTGQLMEIRRNSGQIVTACHDIRAGRQFSVCGQLRPAAGENLRLLSAGSGKAAMEKIVTAIRTIGQRGLANPIWECQVIVAVNKKSELGREAVNKRLQTELNPSGKRAGDNPFRVGDKIVCLKNGFYPIVEDAPDEYNQETAGDNKKVPVANGEQAAVKHVEPRLTIAQLDAPARLIKIPRGGGDEGNGKEESAGTGCQWALAYGITCHKSQGSEWPFVFVVLDEYPGAKMVCSREWLYTGISRAKTACFLVGKLGTAYEMIQREAIKKRKTFLVEGIHEHK